MKLRTWNTVIELTHEHVQQPLYVSIAESILHKIQSGKLNPGDPLPGTRTLAQNFKHSRLTVMQALKRLEAQGWLVATPHKGTFVAPKSNWPKQTQVPSQSDETARLPKFPFNRFQTALSLLKDAPKASIVFDDGFADLKLSPVKHLMTTYRSLYEQRLRFKKVDAFDSDGPERLRIELNKMLQHHRDLQMDDRHICFIRGNQLSFYLTAQTLLKKGDTVVVEHPGNLFAWEIFQHAGANLESIPVDGEGLNTELLEALCKKKKITAVYVTPQCQYPTTVIMSERRRQQLIQLAHGYDFTIIESDYEQEFWFHNEPILPLAARNIEDRVVYVGSLSRMLNPLMRVGYVAGPSAFIESLKALTMSVDSCGDFVLENTIASLMSEGTLNLYIRKSSAVYKERRLMMSNLLDSYFSGITHFSPPPGGLAFWIPIHVPFRYETFQSRLTQWNVAVPPMQLYNFPGAAPVSALRLGFGSVPSKDMEIGLRLIAKALTA